MKKADEKNYREAVYQIVRKIPPGRVTTYGRLAMMLGEGYTARTVGYVMHGAGDNVPWHRVINSQGKCSTDKLTVPQNLQQAMLEQEGIAFNDKGKCDLKKFIWPNEIVGHDEETILFDAIE